MAQQLSRREICLFFAILAPVVMTNWPGHGAATTGFAVGSTAGSATRLFDTLMLDNIALNHLFLASEIILAFALGYFLNLFRTLISKELRQVHVLTPELIACLIVGILAFGLFNSTDGPINRQFQQLANSSAGWHSTSANWAVLIGLVRTWRTATCYAVIILGVLTVIAMQGTTANLGRTFLATASILALLSLGKLFFDDFALVAALRLLVSMGLSSAVVLYQAIVVRQGSRGVAVSLEQTAVAP